MKKIENILCDYGLIIKIVLVVLFIFWAVQLIRPIKSSISEEINYQKNRDAESEMQAMKELQVFANNLVEKAEEKGEKYTPKMYFEDLKRLKIKASENRIEIPGPIGFRISDLVYNGMRKGYFTHAEVQVEAESFSEWNENFISKRDELKNPGLWKVLHWFSTLYFRTIFLVLIFYLVRMSDRKGILNTILAEKMKFVSAIFLWPVFFVKYPFNVVREIRVEAELKRLKSLFRHLSPKEVRLVREVANSSYYKQWLISFNQGNKGKYRRGLFLALIATICFHLFIPSTAKAQNKESVLIVTISSQSHQTIIEDSSENENQQQTDQVGLLPEPIIIKPLLFVSIVLFVKEIWVSNMPDSIDYIPRNALFGEVFDSINQIRKGIRNGYNQKNNFSYGFVGFG